MIIRPHQGIMPRLGQRVFIAENAAIIGDVELGDDVSVWYGTTIRGDVHSIRVGARSNIQDNCVIHVTNGTWPVVIEEEVTLGHGVIAHGCTIRTHSLIGMGATILDGAVVGESCLIGARALVTEGMHAPPRSLVLGAPAKVKRQLTDEEVERIQINFRNYLEYKEIYLAEDGGSSR